ncbi:MAG: OmpA family protein [Gammaproteobacteria bacterium]|nr:OmpA family protein [Gammaproteobacteria bacterium]MDH5802384.1 OmpA family protein [Gammaproteobacteria bacterium]
MGNAGLGPIGHGSNCPEIDSQTLSLTLNISPGALGLCDSDNRLGSANVATPVLVENQLGMMAVFYFANNSFVLNRYNDNALKRLHQKLIAIKDDILTIRVDGHASSEGKSVQNQKLSKNRAYMVSSLLGLESLRLNVETHYYGSSKPAEDETGKRVELEDKRIKNRRVEVFVFRLSEVVKKPATINLFPREVFDQLPDTALMQYMLSLPSVSDFKTDIVAEKYLYRLFDELYDPGLGKLDKALMRSKVGDVLKFFGVDNLNGPVRGAVLNQLYSIGDQSNLDPKAKEALKAIIESLSKTNFGR